MYIYIYMYTYTRISIIIGGGPSLMISCLVHSHP